MSRPVHRIVSLIRVAGFALVLGGLLPASSASASEPAPSPAAKGTAALFEDVTSSAGPDFRHDNGMDGAWVMAEIMGAGAALFDADGDGDLDAYLVQGGAFGDSGARPSDRLFRNQPDPSGAGFRFVDITSRAGLGGATGHGMGVATGDYDLDGDIDLYLANYGANQLWRNRGDGTFENRTDAAGAGDRRWSVSATFVDYDRDGDLDLYIANYVASPLDQQITCKGFAGHRDYCGPQTYAPERDRLLRNRGDGSFEDVSDAVLGTEARGAGLGVVSADFDGDGWLDIYVANDLTANHLWLNRAGSAQGRRFVDEALLAGCATNDAGLAEASMGVVAGDMDGDGDVDLFMTHHDQQTNTFYRNEGQGFFTDASLKSGLGNPSWNYTGFGTALADFDGNGELDLVVANGAVTVKTDQMGAGEPFPFHEPNQLFLGQGDGSFVEAAAVGGEALGLSEVSRGLAWGDVDGDGDVDLLSTNNNGPARLWLNRSMERRSKPWIGLRLLAGEGQAVRDAQGARARVSAKVAGRATETGWQRFGSDGSYASAGDPRRVFVLGAEGAPVALTDVRVRWEDGSEEIFEASALGAVGSYSTLRQGTGRRVEPEAGPDDGANPRKSP